MTAVLTTLASISINSGGLQGGLLVGAKGDVFGTTDAFPISGLGDDAIFELVHNNDGTYTQKTLFSFSGSNGAAPNGGLIADANGDLFGTTEFGGANGFGTVFELVHNNDGTYTQKTLLDFNDSNGSGPLFGLITDANGDLFGTTSGNQLGAIPGTSTGTVFELVPNNDGTYTLNNLLTGEYPDSPVVADANGNLFGTTFLGGGPNGFFGTIFELVRNSDGTYTPGPVATPIDLTRPFGVVPSSPLAAPDNGIDELFGVTQTGGSAGDGTVFMTFPGDGDLTALFSFTGSNGAGPNPGLIIDANGDLFGTTSRGGANDFGTVFELVNNKGQYTLNTLVNFTGSNGAVPVGALIADANGDLFGTTSLVGANKPTVFEITNSGFAPVPLDHWTNTRGGNWSRAGNWVTLGADQLPTTPALNEVPTAGLIADIDASGFFGLTTGTSYSIDDSHRLRALGQRRAGDG